MRRALPFLLLALLIATGQSQTTSRGALGWRLERFVVRGSSLPKLIGAPIERLRAVAFQGGKMVTIPFQVDERDAKNQYILQPFGKDPVMPPSKGNLKNNDEIVFIAVDAGDGGKVAQARVVYEIELKNPNDGSRGYVYIVDFAGEPPALSKVDYVSYTKKGDREEVSTQFYKQAFLKQHVFYDELAILPAAGGNGKNFLDKIKMRTEVHTLGGKVKIARTEEDFRSTVTGVKDGPVRVIRRNETRIAIVMGMKSPGIVVDATFYRTTFEVPSMFSLPFRMDIVASDATFRQGPDLNRNAIGMRYYNNFSREGIAFDGKMTSAKEALAKSPISNKWAMITGAPGTMLYVGYWAMGSPMKILTYYRDDLSAQDPPENEPGVMMYGHRFENILAVKNETYAFNLINYIVPNYDGNINAIAALADHSIQLNVK